MKPSSTTEPTKSTATISITTLSPQNEDHQQHNVPLLMQQPCYARSKPISSDELRNLRIILKWCALDHSYCFGRIISYALFVVLAMAAPLLISIFIGVSHSASIDDPFKFNKLVQLPESALALIAFFTLSRFFRRYGLRQLLFLDILQDDSMYVRRGYTRELEKAFKYLSFIILPSFFVQLAHKILLFTTANGGQFPLNSILFLLVLVSWVYRTGVFLLMCVLFRLTCELQILRFEGLKKLFEGCGDGCNNEASVIFREHVRIRRQLWVTSHRYRFFIIGCLVTISVSQLAALLLVLESKSHKTFFNSGDLVICSAVQLSGFLLCLVSAARITHRAQGIVSIATKWHMLVTNASAESEQFKAQMIPPECDSDSDSDSHSEGIYISVASQQRPSSSFQTRQALVTYLQHNYGGITVFGFLLDRGLLYTLFAFEFSLVMWILSKVVVLS
ncbi:hypothetical protein HN51_032580 [Arachis hypogaea]|uniref:Uncharacterized protein n=1 Tax=Arachis hypogaea TaxID=3818 RepID=A0A445B413_ARAHY|nr:uncharacterized protein LOC112716199 [Arachis hypogaea]RYR33424.1 hypothetical protein Ahy_A10g048010 [Arachis hypogaea]